MAAQVLVGIVKEQILFRKSAHLVEVIITLQKNVSKGKKKEKEKARAVDVKSNRKI